MNRTQKKCLIVSSALHALLLGVILFGAALMPEDRSMPFKPIKLYSLANVTDAPTSGEARMSRVLRCRPRRSHLLPRSPFHRSNQRQGRFR